MLSSGNSGVGILGLSWDLSLTPMAKALTKFEVNSGISGESPREEKAEPAWGLMFSLAMLEARVGSSGVTFSTAALRPDRGFFRAGKPEQNKIKRLD